MKRAPLVLLISMLALFSATISAQEQVLEVPCEEYETGCIDTRTWHLSASIGYGERSNPLRGGKALPIYLVPDIYYYGDRFFFDNGILGLSLQQRSRVETSLVTQLNLERAYFASNLTGIWLGNQTSGSGDVSLMPPTDPPGGSDETEIRPLRIDDVASRRWALDGGVQLDMYPHKLIHVRMQLLTDLTGVHHGQQMNIRLATAREGHLGLLEVGAELNWKSRDLIDYYYGVNERDSGVPTAFYYEGRAVWQPALTASWHYPLNAQWSWVSSGRLQWLGSGMSDSPLAERRHVSTFFTGVSYRF
ncbi:MipA/OmpV family protein [Aliidiomarina sanyensis]|uniref:MipA/OmpV family protein n=1 Tax=Aliidiomarina sanyensis TaxID=1249555 RepID=A0A432WBQ5_9GAMM|nr:MipA/OmpV family protein [Aliidiomarina sanyensis]RUO29507.1 hypothetical protein CWE11_09675 [Aliidiomarina sanyensis]